MTLSSGVSFVVWITIQSTDNGKTKSERHDKNKRMSTKAKRQTSSPDKDISVATPRNGIAS
jgi:hypothetical protein